MESRQLLSSGKDRFATLLGQVASAGKKGSHAITIATGDFTLARGKVTIGLLAEPAAGSKLDPGFLDVRAKGKTSVRSLLRDDDIARAKASLTIIQVGAGGLTLSVRGEGRTKGAYEVSAFLVGDVNGDHRVTSADINAIRKAMKRSRGFPVEADVNRDGRVNAKDLALAQRNLGARTKIRPLTLNVGLAPGSDPNGDRVVDRAAIALRGRTLGGATVRLDQNGNGKVDQTKKAAGNGSYAFSITIAPGRSTHRVTAADRFGQVRTASLSVTLKDNVAPLLTIDRPIGGQATRQAILSGAATDAGSGLEKVEAQLDGGAFFNVPVDASGRFQLALNLPSNGSADGTHRIFVRATDRAGRVATSGDPDGIVFILDTRAPQVPNLALAPESDTAPLGDNETTQSSVNLVGQTEAGATVILTGTGPDRTTTADDKGQFRFENVTLVVGQNPFTVRASDAAGNTASSSQVFTRLPSGPGNIRPPVLDPLAASYTVMPGGRLEIPLVGSDPDGDFVSYALRSADGRLPTGELGGDGVLRFTPAPQDIGTYDLFAVATDGTFEAMRAFRLEVVPDPVTTTRISGFVRNTADEPLAGVPVTVGGSTVHTAADGSFTIVVPTSLVEVDTITFDGGALPGTTTYPTLPQKFSAVIDHPVYSGVNNVLTRALYLPALDTANAKTVSATTFTEVTSPAIPGAKLTVQPGTLLDSQGQAHTGKLGFTVVSPDRMPAPLPKAIRPAELYTLQPSGLQFTQPALLSLPNVGGYKPGTEMVFHALDPSTGQLQPTGTGQVSPDGSSINSNGGAAPMTGVFYCALPKDYQDPEDPEECDCDDCEDEGGGGPSFIPANWTLPPDTPSPPPLLPMTDGRTKKKQQATDHKAQGVAAGVILVYSARRADPRSILRVGYDYDNFGYEGDSGVRLMSTFTISQGNFRQVLPGSTAGIAHNTYGGENFWRLPDTSGKVEVGYRADLRYLPTGTYEYTVDSGVMRFDGSRVTGNVVTRTGRVSVVNAMHSPFGSGWGLAGYGAIAHNADGSVLLYDGDGTQMYFGAPSTPGGAYVSEPGNAAKLVREADGSYTYTEPGQYVSKYAAGGWPMSVSDPNGNTTTYLHDAQGRLLGVVDPAGQTTVFAYDASGKVVSMTDPAGRVTTLEYDGAGNLTRLNRPEGQSVAWTYDANHLMTSETDPNENTTQLDYDFAGSVHSVTYPDGATATYQFPATRGLFPAGQTRSPILPPVALTKALTPTFTVIDPDGQVTSYQLDAMGRHIGGSDGVGSFGTVHRDHGQQITQKSDARGNVALYTYDDAGNLISARDSASTDALIRGRIDAVGERDRYTFTVAAGTWIHYDVIGSLGEGISARLIRPDGTNETFFYTGTFDVGPLRLTQGGTYTLEFTGDRPGDYAFQLSDASASEELPIGRTIVGTTDPRLGTEMYRYEAQAGDRILILDLMHEHDPNAGSHPPRVLWTVIGPDGLTVTNEYTSLSDATSFEATLPQAGTYLVIAQAGTHDGELGPVDFHVLFTRPPTTTQALTLDTDVIANITEPGARIEYTFAGTVGQRLVLEPRGPSEMTRFQLIGPNGAVVLDPRAFLGDAPATLPATGTYTLRVEGYEPGAIRFRLSQAESLTPITFGTPVAGRISEGDPTLYYRLTGTKGHELRFDVLEASAQFGAFWTLYGPDGQRYGGDLVGDFSAGLRTDGTYVLAIEPFEGLDFRFQVDDIAGAPVVPSGFGVDHTGTITAGQSQSFPFTAPAGFAVYVDSFNTSTSLKYTIVAPDGRTFLEVFSGVDQGPFLLPKAGTYTLRVQGINAFSSGDFGLRLLDLSAAPLLALGTTREATFASGLRTDVYRFSGTVGQALYYDALDQDNDQVRMSLYPPGGLMTQRFESPSAVYSGDAEDDSPGLFVLPATGEYYLVLSSQQATPARYKFRLLDLASAPLLQPGVPQAGRIADPLQIDLYRLAGQAGQTGHFSFPTTSEEHGIGGSLSSPGVTLQDPNFFPAFSNLIYLPATADYGLIVEGRDLFQTEPVDYTVLYATQPTSTAPLTLGSPTTATIVSPGDRVGLTVTLAAGQMLFFDGRDRFPSESQVVLIKPDGKADRTFSLPSDTRFDSTEFLKVTEPGVYRIDVTSRQPGDYRFALHDVASLPVLPIGPQVAGHLDVGQTLLYRFEASAGQRYYFSHNPDSTRPFLGQWYISDSEGRRIFDGQIVRTVNFGHDLIADIPADGTYYLGLQNESATTPTDFAFRVLRPTISTVAAAADGTTINGSIDVPGEVDYYEFQGTAGQRIYIDNLKSFGAGSIYQIGLIGPDGKAPTNTGSGDDLSVVLPLTGTYRVVAPSLSVPDTGQYAFRILDADAATPIVPGQPFSGRLDPRTTHLYTLSGTAGQRFRFDMTSVSGNTGGSGWGVADAHFRGFGGNSIGVGGDFDVTLPHDGTIVVVVASGTGTIDYEFQVTAIADTPVAPSGFGTVRSGSIAAGQTATFDFAAPAGMPFYYDSLDDNWGGVAARFTGPISAVIPFSASSFDQGPFIIPASGTSTATVAGFDKSSTGDYAFRLIDLRTVPELTFNTTTSGTLENGFETDVYRFNGQIGQSIIFDSIAAPAQSSAISYQLHAPDGTLWHFQSDPANDNNAPFALKSSGTYYLFVVGQRAESSSYTFRVSDIATMPATPIGTTFTGRLDPGVEADLYAFDGKAGESLYFHSQSVSEQFGGSWNLYGPGNTIVPRDVGSDSTSLSSSFGVQLPADGRYVLAIRRDFGTGPIDYSFSVTTSAITTQPYFPQDGLRGRERKVYDPVFGALLQESDALGRLTLYEIDPANGNRLKATRVVGAVGGDDDLVTHYTYTSKGLLASMTDPEGRRTTYQYDAKDRLIQVTIAVGTPAEATRRYEYDAAGNVTAEIDELGWRSEYAYDGLNRLVRVTLPDPDGAGPLPAPVTRYAYDPASNLVSITDPLGRVTRYGYNARGLQSSETDAAGNVTRYEYTPSGLLSAIVDPLGHRTTLEYDPRKRLIRTTDPEGGTTLIGYDADDNIISVTDPNGYVSTILRDARGRAVAITDGRGFTSRYEFDAADNLVAVTDPNGHTTRTAYDDLGRPISTTDALGNVTHYAYDKAGNLKSVLDALGNLTRYEHDARNRLTAVIDALGGRWSTSYDKAGNVVQTTDPLGHSRTFTLDALGRVTQSTDAAGGVTRTAYDAAGRITSLTDELGRTTSFEYDDLDRVVRVVDALGGVTTREYDAAGNLTRQIDPRGNATTFAYDRAGRLVRVTDALGGQTNYTYDAAGNITARSNALGHATRYEYDGGNFLTRITDALDGTWTLARDAYGNITSQTDPLGRVTRYEYDPLGRLTAITDPADGIHRRGYDALGRLISETDPLGHTTLHEYDALGRATAHTDALGNTHSIAYDAAGNITRITDPLGRSTTYEYDALDRLVKQTDPLGGVTATAYDAVGNIVEETDALGRRLRYEYDGLDRLIRAIDPLNNATTFAYDAVGNQTSLTDPLGQVVTTTYDALNRPASITDAGGNKTTFTYDLGGRRTSVTDPLGNVTNYDYDALNRRVAEVSSLGTRTYTYNAVGRQTSVTDRNGRVRRFEYDALDRLVAEDWIGPDGKSTRRLSFAYDAAGRLTSASDPDSSYAYTYDALGRTTSLTNAGTPGAPTVTFAYQYDAASNRTQRAETVAGQAGTITNFTYDAANRLTRITQSGGGANAKRVDLTYSAIGELTGIARFSDLAGTQAVAATTFTYDDVGRVSAIAHMRGAATLASYALAYDEASRIISRTGPEGTTRYTYDNRDQLIGVDHPGGQDESYEYDAAGNRIGTGVTIGSENRLLADADATYTYDAEGNLVRRTDATTGETTEYTFDHRNRLTSVIRKNSAGAVTLSAFHVYDIFDRRIASTVDPDGAGPAPSRTERTVYDGADIALRFDGAGNLTHRTLYGPAVDQLLADETAAGTLWALADQQGSVRDLIDGTGAVRNHIDYDSFGRIRSETDPTIDLLAAYTGRPFDRASGLYDYRARVYDPSTGRFLSQDPMGFAAGDPNLYRYVGNSAVNHIDPSGMIYENGPNWTPIVNTSNGQTTIILGPTGADSGGSGNNGGSGNSSGGQQGAQTTHDPRSFPDPNAPWRQPKPKDDSPDGGKCKKKKDKKEQPPQDDPPIYPPGGGGGGGGGGAGGGGRPNQDAGDSRPPQDNRPPNNGKPPLGPVGEGIRDALRKLDEALGKLDPNIQEKGELAKQIGQDVANHPATQTLKAVADTVQIVDLTKTGVKVVTKLPTIAKNLSRAPGELARLQQMSRQQAARQAGQQGPKITSSEQVDRLFKNLNNGNNQQKTPFQRLIEQRRADQKAARLRPYQQAAQQRMGQRGPAERIVDLTGEGGGWSLLQPMRGYSDVIIHGSPTTVLSEGARITAEQLKNQLISQGLTPGTPVRLLSCNTGRLPNGFAQQFANQWGAEVLAPTDFVNVIPESGAIYIENGGRLVSYMPTF